MNNSVRPAFAVLTGFRGFAALWVMSYHAWVLSGPRELSVNLTAGWSLSLHPLLSVGWAGVQLLFVLSAFLLTLTLTAPDKQPPMYQGYFIRRFARVFPAYYVQLFFLLGVAMLTQGVSVSELELLQSLNYLIMNFTPPPLGEGNQHLNGVWWTLPIELSFYLVLPILLRVTGGHLVTIAVFSLLTTAAWRLGCVMYAPKNQLSPWFSQLPGSMDSFGIGVLTALAYRRSLESTSQIATIVKRWSRSLVVSSVGVILCLIYWMDFAYLSYLKLSFISFLWTPLFSLACAILILVSCIDTRAMRLLFGNCLIIFAGEASYGIYLWHLPITEGFLKIRLFADYDGYIFPTLWLAVCVGSVCVGALSWKIVEQPAQRWAAKYG
jgi:peptidoglycan/LPS O-acetylase OafA/YrhL